MKVPRVPHGGVGGCPHPPYSQVLVKCKVGKHVESHINFQLLLSLSHTHTQIELCNGALLKPWVQNHLLG
jgi:Ser-tRNA(Ala) deacylase AlaX